MPDTHRFPFVDNPESPRVVPGLAPYTVLSARTFRLMGVPKLTAKGLSHATFFENPSHVNNHDLGASVPSLFSCLARHGPISYHLPHLCQDSSSKSRAVRMKSWGKRLTFVHLTLQPFLDENIAQINATAFILGYQDTERLWRNVQSFWLL